MEFEYSVETDKAFDDAVDAVQEALGRHNFRVLAVHDVAETLAEKGFEREPVTIIETCNARYAHQVLEADVAIALMLPCPIVVHEREGRVHISTMRPSAIASFYPEADIEDVAGEVEDVLTFVVDEASR